MILETEESARAFVAARCSEGALANLNHLSEMLADANETQNLVASSTLPVVWIRHFADSIQLLDHVPRGTDGGKEAKVGAWVDLGAGAGFPGLPIAIAQPDREVVLVESRGLRIQWLNDVISALNLTNCRVMGSDVRKVETFAAGVISARAFAPLPRLVELSARFSTNATHWVLPKGRSAAQDIATLPPRLQTRFHVKQSVTDPEARIVVASGHLEWPS